MKVAINGFGRIGRSIYRMICQDPNSAHEVVAINDISPTESIHYLLKYDTIMGRFPFEINFKNSLIETGNQKTKVLGISDPTQLPWQELGVDVVIESSGVFRTRQEISKHLEAGSKKVLLTVPPKDEVDALVVYGINDHMIKPEHQLISNASCTTNCLAPVAKVLLENFGIESGLMTTVHAYTNDQKLMDVYHKDPRRGRAAAQNIIPTTTGAAKVVGKIIPELSGKIDGTAMRVPTVNGSVVDFTAQLSKKTTVEEVNQAFKKAADADLSYILEYCTDPIVSSDIIGNPKSSIFDSQMTKMVGDSLVKVVSWYDNEWGYSSRIIDLLKKVS